MIIFTTPAKRLDENTKYPKVKPTLPQFLDKSDKLINILNSKSVSSLQKLFEVSKNIATVNKERFSKWSKIHTEKNARPAIFSFNGDVHRELHPRDYNKQQFEYMCKHLRILSGLYGILRPLDLIQPYRLTMGTHISINKEKSLHKFWSQNVTDSLNNDIKNTKSKFLIDLASEEYSKTVDFNKIIVPTIHVGFRQEKKGILENIGILNKKARGYMIDFMIKNKVKDLNELTKFDYNGYSLLEQKENSIIFKTKI